MRPPIKPPIYDNPPADTSAHGEIDYVSIAHPGAEHHFCQGSGICALCDDSAKCVHCKGTTICPTCMGDGDAGGKLCPECNGAKECSHCTPMGVALHCPACNNSSYCPHCAGNGTVSAN